jgi:hypothetical protein
MYSIAVVLEDVVMDGLPAVQGGTAPDLCSCDIVLSCLVYTSVPARHTDITRCSAVHISNTALMWIAMVLVKVMLVFGQTMAELGW